MAMRVSMSGGWSSAVKTPLEARHEALFQVCDFARRPVARHDDLLVAVEKRVEGVEKFLLGAFLAREELDIVDEQHVGEAVLLAEFDERGVLNGVNELVGETLAAEM